MSDELICKHCGDPISEDHTFFTDEEGNNYHADDLGLNCNLAAVRASDDSTK